MKFCARLDAAMTERKAGGATALARVLTNFLHELGEMAPNEKVPAQTIQSILDDRSKSSTYTVHLAYVLSVNPFWLAFGVGEMLDDAAQHIRNMTVDELEVARMWRKLPRSEQQMFHKFLKTFAACTTANSSQADEPEPAPA